jgi:hypothetical protein
MLIKNLIKRTPVIVFLLLFYCSCTTFKIPEMPDANLTITKFKDKSITIENPVDLRKVEDPKTIIIYMGENPWYADRPITDIVKQGLERGFTIKELAIKNADADYTLTSKIQLIEVKRTTILLFDFTDTFIQVDFKLFNNASKNEVFSKTILGESNEKGVFKAKCLQKAVYDLVVKLIDCDSINAGLVK